MKKIISLLTSLSIVMSMLGTFTALAEEQAAETISLNVGDYVQMGVYDSQPMIYRVAAFQQIGEKTDNGVNYDKYAEPQTFSATYQSGYYPLMFYVGTKSEIEKDSDSGNILPSKAFSAKGIGYPRSDSNRENFGTNYWEDCNLRTWLNSDEAAPTYNYVQPDYASEAGFLTNFSAEEKGAILKNITQKTIISRKDVEADAAAADGGTEKHTQNQSASSAVQNYDTAYYKNSTDSVFVPSVPQILQVYNNLNSAYTVNLANHPDAYYWLRDAYSDDTKNTRLIWSNGTVLDINAYNSRGVRPAFFLDLSKAVFESGDGTGGNPYIATSRSTDEVIEISTLAQLEQFRDDVNSGNTYEGKTVKLTADIDMSEKYGKGKESWTPIGVSDYPNSKYFYGTFEGGNHTISGLYAYTEEQYGIATLFDSIYGTLENLNVKGTVISNNQYDSCATGIAAYLDANAQMLNCSFEGLVKSPNYSAGGLVETNMGLISNCRFKGKVEGMHLVAGIASTGEGTIINCTNEGEIIGTGPVGGIAGYGKTIKGCVNKGSVTGRTYTLTYTDYESGEETTENLVSCDVGGIVGDSVGGIIENCYNIGTVSGNSEVGGIIGVAPIYSMPDSAVLSQVKNCYNTGKITSTMENDGEHNIGGIIGSSEYNYTCDGENFTKVLSSEAVHCYYLVGTADKGCGGNADDTATALTAEQFADKTNFSNWDFDTVWEMNKTLKRPVLRSNREAYIPYEIDNVNDLIAFRNAVNNGHSYEGETVMLNADIDISTVCGKNINGKEISWEPISDNNLIPFIGTFDGGFHKITGLYSTSSGLFMFNSGTIQNVSVSGEIICQDFAGGIVVENIGKISRCSFSGSITGGSHIGGIAGMNIAMDEGTGIFDCYNTATVNSNGGVVGGIACLGRIERCYNIGSIQAEDYFASIAAGEDMTVTDCYYLIGTADKGTYPDTFNTTALTAEQFADKTNFANWDFDTVWKMDETLKRPVLRSGTEEPPTQPHTHKICGDANCTDNHEDIEWTAWNSADTLPTETGNYCLTKDVTISLPWSPEDGTALCLNGHSIRQTDKLCVIRPGGIFSLCDCAGGGTVTGGALGVAVMGEENVFNMYGGKITENHWKGGVFDGGGIVCYDGGVFNMYGGEISSNSSDAIGGVTVWGQMSIGGKAVIRDNTNAGGVMENLFLSSDSIITVNSPITDGSYIGIAYYPAFMRKFPKTISGANDADYSQYFHSDNATYKIINGENNVLQFVYKNNSYPYYEITDVFAVDTKNNTLDVIPPNTEFTVYAPIEQIAALEGTNYGTVILAAYDEDGALIDIGTEKITNPEYFPCAYTASLHSDERTVKSLKAFIWDGVNSMIPLSNACEASYEYIACP